MWNEWLSVTICSAYRYGVSGARPKEWECIPPSIQFTKVGGGEEITPSPPTCNHYTAVAASTIFFDRNLKCFIILGLLSFYLIPVYRLNWAIECSCMKRYLYCVARSDSCARSWSVISLQEWVSIHIYMLLTLTLTLLTCIVDQCISSLLCAFTALSLSARVCMLRTREEYDSNYTFVFKICE